VQSKEMSWEKEVNESVEFYNDKINQQNKKLENKDLEYLERKILESEKMTATNQRTKWKLEQEKLKHTSKK
jgi:hypothetical protein